MDEFYRRRYSCRSGICVFKNEILGEKSIFQLYNCFAGHSVMPGAHFGHQLKIRGIGKAGLLSLQDVSCI